MSSYLPHLYDETTCTDVLVIGAGPVGLNAAFWAGMRGLTCRIVEAMPEIGGQLAVLYPDKWIYDIPGHKAIKARNLVLAMFEQSVAQFRYPVHLNCRAETLRHHDDYVELATSTGVFRARAVILAVGHGAFAPRKLPEINLDAWETKGVHYFVPSVDRFAGRRVMIIGGGDSACDWALEMISARAKGVSLVHRRDTFRAHSKTVDELLAAKASGAIDILTPYQIADVEGRDRISAVVLRHADGSSTRRIEVDDVLLQLGFVSALGPLLKWGMQVQQGAISVDSGMRSSLSRVWACGDASTYEGKIKLIATGFAEAASAVAHAAAFVAGKAVVQPEHSTTSGVPVVHCDRTEVVT